MSIGGHPKYDAFPFVCIGIIVHVALELCNNNSPKPTDVMRCSFSIFLKRVVISSYDNVSSMNLEE